MSKKIKNQDHKTFLEAKEVAQVSSWEKRDQQTKQVIGQLKAEKPVEVLFEGLDLSKYYKNPTKSDILKDISEILFWLSYMLCIN